MRRRGQDGFSLIEVVIALGLLAGVLIAIAGLFIYAGKSVKSGRTSSEALAMAREIVEEMNGWGFTQLWGNFGVTGNGVNTLTFDTATCVTADCTSWQSTLVSRLGSTAHATIKLDSIMQGVGAPPNFAPVAPTSSKNVRVTVTVLWTQLTGRNRQVQVVTSRN